MKSIEFRTETAQRVYRDYLKRCDSAITSLGQKDQVDIVMEMNSHIFEGTRGVSKEEEVGHLLDVLEKLGDPNIVLKPLVAAKKLEQAYRTFHPVHVFRALVLNIGNGISFLIFSLLYILLFGFVYCIGAEIMNPQEVGLFVKDGVIQNLGQLKNAAAQGYEDVLGHWFIPVMIIATVLLYLFITLLLKWTRQLRKNL